LGLKSKENHLLEEKNRKNVLVFCMQMQIIGKSFNCMMTSVHNSFVHIHHDLDEEEKKILEMAGVKSHSLRQEVSQKIEDEFSFFIPKCHACKEEMEFTEGDIIYGDKWYHNSCWEEPREVPIISH
jgi:hypothetical protein